MADSNVPAKKAPAKKAAAKKAPATKTAAKKTAAKKTAAKKTAAKKTAAKKVPAEKAPAKEMAAPSTKASAKQGSSKGSSKKRPSKKGPTTKVLRNAKKTARSAPGSKYFKKARSRASKMVDDPKALKEIAAQANAIGSQRSGPFAEVIDDFRTMIRLVVAYARGHYRDIRVDSLVLVVAGLIYVVSPADLIPDIIPVAGYVDDVVVVGWIVKLVRDELNAFREWELGSTED